MTLRNILSKFFRPCPLIVVMIVIVAIVLIAKSASVNTARESQYESLSRASYWRAEDYAQLSAREAFENLSVTRKSFTYHLNKAAWLGSFISAAQTSPESPCLMLIVLKALQMGLDSRMEKAGFSDDEKQSFRRYACGVLSSQGNYRGEDNQKFIPEEIEVSKLKAFFEDAWPSTPKNLTENASAESPSTLGFPPQGQTQYWRGMNLFEAESVVRFMQAKGIFIGNQFAVMTKNATGRFVNLRFSSELKSSEGWIWEEYAEGRKWEGFEKISVSRGAHSGFLTLIIKELESAIPHAEDKHMAKSLGLLVDSLVTGDLKFHLEAGKEWVNALDQQVDTYMGFMENYLDPKNVQLEYSSFVGIEDSGHLAAFKALTERSAELTSKLPWGREFEPDSKGQANLKSFSSLVVTSYVANVPPRGVNLPNHDDVKLVGQKNFNIANVVEGKAKFLVLAFLNEEDKELLQRLYVQTFTIKIGIHELLGHGSGLLLRKDEEGKLNFNESLIDPTTNSKISHWYSPGETFYSVFGDIAAAYEETRANCIALYLACDPEVLETFGHRGQNARDVCVAVYLNQVFSGLTALANYNPESKWLSAHAQSEFVILRALMEALPNFARIEEGKDDIRITVDRNLIPEATTDAFKDFVQKIQIYRLTANIQAAKELFATYSDVDETWLRLRKIVLAKKAGLKEPSFVQGNIQTEDKDGATAYKWIDYPASCEGLLNSWKERFGSDELQAIQKAVEEYVEVDG